MDQSWFLCYSIKTYTLWLESTLAASDVDTYVIHCDSHTSASEDLKLLSGFSGELLQKQQERIFLQLGTLPADYSSVKSSLA